MVIFKKVKENLFLVLVAIAYIVLFIIKPDIAFDSVKNSRYYIIEMLQIMPVIFVLTALLDMWIPKQMIMKYLGAEAKLKGILLSFLLGSFSAGPIYSAFPICIMLLKKGASIRNIVIILSSWAVIKIPMLINEVKFLGVKFMAIRWVLTIVAIIIFSYITDLIVKTSDIPTVKLIKAGGYVNKDYCIGCSICTRVYPDLFAMDGKKAYSKDIENIDQEKLKEASEKCPTKAINL